MPVGMTLLHALRYAIGKDRAHTQTSQLERDALVRHVTGKRRAAEIGVYEGATTAVLARAMKVSGGGTLFAIDPFYAGRVGFCWSELIARWEIRRRHVGDIVSFVKATSTDAARHLDGDFDFAFVDGDHSLEGVAQDWKDWSRRIAGGGIIGLHDSRVPEHNSSIRDLASVRYFESHIRNDSRFVLVDQVDSLSLLQRI